MAWAEKDQVLGELQNGFRPGRCLEDNLFVVTQAMKIAAKEKRTLLLAFLDIAQAYDTVKHPKLWETLRDLGLPDEFLRLLISLYSGTQVVIHWLPALFYAEDIVLLAGSTQELQSTLDIVSSEGASLGLRFNARKSATMSCRPIEDIEDPPLL
ncbi:uncharacterized protein LOC144175734 [Haemaphysalis longicornis]